MNEEIEIPATQPEAEGLEPEPVPTSEDVDFAAARLEELESECAQLQELCDALKNENLRLRADTQNMRKRHLQEMDRYRVLANERLVLQLLPVLDSFERAVASGENGASVETMLEGLRAVEKQMRGALDEAKVVAIAETGVPFDPDQHDAVLTMPSDEHPEDTVVKILETGYRLADKVIRPAKVQVSKLP
ncbi:MAG: nucleotide exchange factor GrpE [Fimbriimonadaceae bacterium]|nr:nucleotide exchange factor GrpE [Fimbriimonadaceae bacterium]